MQQTATPDEGLRARQKRARREALIDATHRLVAEHGLDAVTVEAICDEAGVSVRTFFNYFDSKDDAVLGHVPWIDASAEAEEFVAGGPTGHLLDDLQALVAAHLAAPPGHERLRRTMELACHEPRLMAKHLAAIEQHKGQLVQVVERRLGPDSDLPADVVAALGMFLTHATFLRWEAAAGAGSPFDHLGLVVEQFRRIAAD